MTRKKRAKNQQLSIFDWVQKIQQTQTNTLPHGSLDIDSEFRAAVSEDLKHAVDPTTGRELSRYEVAARMSELIGQEITASMLYNYTAEAHEKHRFPCQFLPAFVIATGGQRRAIEVISKHCNLYLLPGPEALRAEIQRLDEEIKKLEEEKQKRIIFLKEVLR
ncbi:hypothetical protein [Thermodesulfovibrio sp.]|uniref:hypothetical protein n=1 Tax=Thermodesulfovibrio sp. TaxID=2067987 RepID=UPI003097C4CC